MAGQISRVQNRVERLVTAARDLSNRASRLRFSAPVTHVYNPLNYARAAHEVYLRKFAVTRKRVLFLGMNPGPFGMAQTGIPFGEIAAVRDWLGICAHVSRPACEHPKRPVLGFDCPRSEISGSRLWGLFAARFTTSKRFFARHFVANYCPLAFLGKSGANITPDKLPIRVAEKLFDACDEHLRMVVGALEPEWVISLGTFARRRAEVALGKNERGVKLGQILHPSPASPAANRDWAGVATQQLEALGVW